MGKSTQTKPKLFNRSGISGRRANRLPNLNRSAIGRATGLGKSHISKILSGKVIPNVQTAKVIADVLGMSLDEFYVFLTRTKSDKTKLIGGLSNGESTT